MKKKRTKEEKYGEKGKENRFLKTGSVQDLTIRRQNKEGK